MVAKSGAKGVIDGLGLLDGVFLGSGGVDHVIGELAFFGEGKLAAEAGFHLFAANAVTGHGSLDLLLFGADDQDDAVVVL